MSTPYQEAMHWIEVEGYSTGSAFSLAKLILSLYNDQCGFAISECIGNLDPRLTRLALAMVEHYARHGEHPELLRAGNKIADDLYPRLWEQGVAMAEVRAELRRRWEREAEAENQCEDPDMCLSCNGTGQFDGEDCLRCQGTGFLPEGE